MIKTLNGIRALLFLFIYGVHFKYLTQYTVYGKAIFKLFNLSRFAVLSFVLISGFCIALGYSDFFKNFSKKLYFYFLKKRFIRMYPLYIITNLIGVYIIHIGGNPVSWFVDVIFICYMITPMILFGLNKAKSLKPHIIFCSINYIILVAFSIYLNLINQANSDSYYRFYLIRIFEYLIALDIGYIYINKYKNNLNFKILDNYFYKSLIDFIYIIIFISIMYILPNNLLYRHVIGLPLICSFFVFMCIEKRSILYDILSSRFFGFLGNISYEFFMIHFLIIGYLLNYPINYLDSLYKIILLYIIILTLTIALSLLYKQAVLLIKKLTLNIFQNYNSGTDTN